MDTNAIKEMKEKLKGNLISLLSLNIGFSANFFDSLSINQLKDLRYCILDQRNMHEDLKNGKEYIYKNVTSAVSKFLSIREERELGFDFEVEEYKPYADQFFYKSSNKKLNDAKLKTLLIGLLVSKTAVSINLFDLLSIDQLEDLRFRIFDQRDIHEELGNGEEYIYKDIKRAINKFLKLREERKLGWDFGIEK